MPCSTPRRTWSRCTTASQKLTRKSLDRTDDTAQTDAMRVVLKFVIDAYPDEVWALLHQPAAFNRAVESFLGGLK